MQNDEYNSNKDYKFVYVVPITTHGHDKQKIKYFKDNNTVPHFHYIGQTTGEEAVANVGDIKRIHKSLLLETTNYNSIDNNIMIDICKKIGILMEIGELEKCNECIYNYNNYISTIEEVAITKEKNG